MIMNHNQWLWQEHNVEYWSALPATFLEIFKNLRILDLEIKNKYFANTKQISSKGISKQTSLFWNPLATELFCICKIFNNLNIWDWVDYSYFVIDALDTWESEARTEDMAERRNGYDQQPVIEDTDQWRSELSHTFILNIGTEPRMHGRRSRVRSSES